MPPFHSVKKVSPGSDNPYEIAISPTPFSEASSSSSNLKLRGTITVSPDGVRCIVYFNEIDVTVYDGLCSCVDGLRIHKRVLPPPLAYGSCLKSGELSSI